MIKNDPKCPKIDCNCLYWECWIRRSHQDFLKLFSSFRNYQLHRKSNKSSISLIKTKSYEVLPGHCLMILWIFLLTGGGGLFGVMTCKRSEQYDINVFWDFQINITYMTQEGQSFLEVIWRDRVWFSPTFTFTYKIESLNFYSLRWLFWRPHKLKFLYWKCICS